MKCDRSRNGDHDQRGYAMAALLVSLSVMAIMLTVLMPVWKHQAQREKEAELIFRGTQFGRALALYERRHGPGTTPPSVNTLVDERFLRKKYKDPINGEDFQVLLQSQQPNQQPGQTGQTPGRGGAQQPGTGTTGIFTTPGRSGGTQSQGFGGSSSGFGGVVGVVSKSTATSIKIYNGHTHYNEWVFMKAQLAPAGGANAPGAMPGVGGQPGRGGPGGLGAPGVGGIGGRGDGRGRGFGPGGGRGPGGQQIILGPNGPIVPPPGSTTFPFPFPSPTPTGPGRGRG